MLHLVFGTIPGWIGTAVIVGAAAIALGYVYPPSRRLAVAVVGVVAGAAFLYVKGARDERLAQQKRADAAAAKAQRAYDEIEQRPDTDQDVVDRLDKGTF